MNERADERHLRDGGIDVWLTFLTDVDEDLPQRYRGLLDEGERRRFDRYKVEGARGEYLVGRALTRTVLSRYRDTAPADWRFVANAHGRPSIAGEADGGLVFNLSHTRGLAALAVARGGEIGLDVETVERASAVRDLAGRYFAPSEARFVLSASDDAMRERFFAFWTLKEAYIKARGLGLALPLGGFAFDLASGEEPAIGFTPDCPDDPARWWFRRLAVSGIHRLALAASPAPRGPVRFFRVVPLSGEPVAIEPGRQRLDGVGDAAPDVGLPGTALPVMIGPAV